MMFIPAKVRIDFVELRCLDSRPELRGFSTMAFEKYRSRRTTPRDATPPGVREFSVYQDINSMRYLIVGSDEMVCMTMRKVYGPSSQESCQAFIDSQTSLSE
jgi:hypothetical protein